jgi:hypothetical protein
MLQMRFVNNKKMKLNPYKFLFLLYDLFRLGS